MVDPVQLFPGFMLADPSYVVTDLLICVFSFYEWAKLRRFWIRPRTGYQQFFLAYFLLMAIATLSCGQWDKYLTNFDDFIAVYLFGIQMDIN